VLWQQAQALPLLKPVRLPVQAAQRPPVPGPPQALQPQAWPGYHR
jgi:hypothetical protein